MEGHKTKQKKPKRQQQPPPPFYTYLEGGGGNKIKKSQQHFTQNTYFSKTRQKTFTSQKQTNLWTAVAITIINISRN